MRKQEVLRAVGVIGGVVLLGIVFVSVIAPWYKEFCKRGDARDLVTSWANALDKRINEDGTYLRHCPDFKSCLLPDIDPWGNQLMVRYGEGDYVESVYVISAGKDGSFDSEDDIAAKRSAVNRSTTKKAMRKAIEGASEDAGRGWVKGVIQGVREEYKKKEDKK